MGQGYQKKETFKQNNKNFRISNITIIISRSSQYRSNTKNNRNNKKKTATVKETTVAQPVPSPVKKHKKGKKNTEGGQPEEKETSFSPKRHRDSGEAKAKIFPNFPLPFTLQAILLIPLTK